MDLTSLVGRFTGVRWNPSRDAFLFLCPNHPETTGIAAAVDGKIELKCHAGCSGDRIIAAIAPQSNGSGPEKPSNGDGHHPPHPEIEEGAAAAASRKAMAEAMATWKPIEIPKRAETNGHGPLAIAPEREVRVWQGRISELVGRTLADDPEFHKPHLTAELAFDALADMFMPIIKGDAEGWVAPAHLSATERAELVEQVIQNRTIAFYLGRAGQMVPWETHGAAIKANEEYLKRTAVVEKLCYSSAVSMITGGKHAGKSTLARWMAICVAKGFTFLGRAVTQGPVLYLASEDETMAARQELLRLGWGPDDPLRFLSSQNLPDDNPEAFLKRLPAEIARAEAVLVVLDMVFDFVRVSDEMSYAGTREALGKVQDVASESGAHVVAIHHAPKHAANMGADVAALGSQGIAARVSPIILVRRFGPGVHSISSTGVRDPRGQMIEENRLLLQEDGSVTLGGSFKMRMLAEVYVPKILEFLKEEPGSEFTPGDVAEALDFSYQAARSGLAALFNQGTIDRTGDGKRGKPYRYSISAADGFSEPPNSKTSMKTYQKTESEKLEDQGRFGYKDN